MRACSLLVACLLLSACPAPAVRPYAPPSAAELLEHLRAHRAGLLALRARAKADYLGDDGGRVKVDIAVVAARPQRLRLAAENSLTGPLMTLATDNESFQLLDVQKNRFLSGAVNPCNMARLMRVALHPREAMEVMMGGVPLLAEVADMQVGWDGRDGGREVLTLRDGRGYSEVIWLAAAQHTWDVREAEGRDPQGKPLWRVRHEDFTPLPLSATAPAGTAKVVRLPAVTYIEDPPHKSDVRLRWRERELNPNLPPEIFHLDPPPGVPVEPDACAGPPPPAAPTPAAPAPASP